MIKRVWLLLGSLLLIPQVYFAEEVTDPTAIVVDDETASLGDTHIPDIFWDRGADFEVHKDNSIKSITVTGNEIETYQNIHVGDSINKVRSKYLLEGEFPDAIGVLLNGDEELDIVSMQEMDEADYTDEILKSVFIRYDYEDDKVSRIYLSQLAAYLDLDIPSEIESEESPDAELTRDQVYVEGIVVTYNEPIPDALKKYAVKNVIRETIPDDAPVKIVINDDGIVRCISILDKSVWTYDGIRQGMVIGKVTEKYDKHIDMGGTICLYYQGDDMLEMDDFPSEETSLIYMYHPDNGKIKSISICDSVFAKIMK